MSTGPQVERLGTYLRHADPGQLAVAAASWHETLLALDNTREMLRRSADLVRTQLSGDYAAAASARLDHLADVTVRHQRQVRTGSQALVATSEALDHAREVYATSQGHGDVTVLGPYTGMDPHSTEAIEHNRLRAQQQQHNEREFDDRETRAASETAYLDTVFRQTDDTMTDIQSPSGSELGRSPALTPTPSPTIPGEPVVPANPRIPSDPPVSQDPDVPRRTVDPVTSNDDTGDDYDVDDRGDDVRPGAPAAPPSPGLNSAQGQAAVATPVTSTSYAAPVTTSGSGGPGVVPGLGVAGGGGGLGGAGAAMRGGLSAQGVRGIGASGSTVTRSGTGSGAGGRSGGAGTRAGTRGGSRSGARAGARSGGVAAGRGGRRRDDDDREQQELGDEDRSQWLDDDATGPDVMGESAPFAKPAAELDDLSEQDLDEVDLAGWLEDPSDEDGVAPGAEPPTPGPRVGS